LLSWGIVILVLLFEQSPYDTQLVNILRRQSINV
jgi:hypothetical protein